MRRESTNLLSAIAAVNIFIEAGIDKGGVLVHCAGGRSRSAAFVVAFIMSTLGCGYDQAYAQVKRARPVASVNRGFEQQLRAYGAAKCNVFAAHQMVLRVKAALLLERRNFLLARASRAAQHVSAIGGSACDSESRPGGTRDGGKGSVQAAPTASPQRQASAGMPPQSQSPKSKGRSSPVQGMYPGTPRREAKSLRACTMGAAAAGDPCVGSRVQDELRFMPNEVSMFIWFHQK